MFCRQLCKRGMRSPSMVRWQHSGEQLSHIRAVQDDNFMPCMVDVSEKAVTSRIAHARVSALHHTAILHS